MNEHEGPTGQPIPTKTHEAAFNWALRRLLQGKEPSRQREPLSEALYEVIQVTGQAGLGALMLFVAHVEGTGEGEDGR